MGGGGLWGLLKKGRGQSGIGRLKVCVGELQSSGKVYNLLITEEFRMGQRKTEPEARKENSGRSRAKKDWSLP